MKSRTLKSSMFAVALLAVGTVIGFAANDADLSDFASTTIDVGVVVSDSAKAVEFYESALGFTKATEFDVAPDLAARAGLTNNVPLHITVMKLSEGPSATKIKLMQVAGVESAQPNHDYIYSTLGLSYLTVFVNDIDKAVDRAAEQGVEVIAEGPVAINETAYLAVVRDPDGNFIELIGPRR